MDLYCAYLFKFDLWIKFASKKSVTTIKMTIKVKLLPLFIFCFYSLPISGINDFCNLKGLCEVINKSVSIQMRCSSHVFPNSGFKICTNFWSIRIGFQIQIEIWQVKDSFRSVAVLAFKVHSLLIGPKTWENLEIRFWDLSCHEQLT